MEKISGILPGSPRVKSVDLKSSAPVRPGAPAFGRPMGIATNNAKIEMTTAEKALVEHKKLVDARKGEEFKTAIARELSQRFFQDKDQLPEPMPHATEDVPEIALPGAESQGPSSLPRSEVSPQPPMAAESAEFGGDDLDAPEIGRYLDVTV